MMNLSEIAKQLGRRGGLKGGKATTPAKAAASKANGAKGGRPRKTPKAETPSESANDKAEAPSLGEVDPPAAG